MSDEVAFQITDIFSIKLYLKNNHIGLALVSSYW